jgi:RimJ/RimL family protein N-acetyltransferase
MTHYTIQRLHEMDRSAIKNHLLRLDKNDRYLRFFAALGDFAIEHYADNVIDLKDGAAFGVIDGNGRLVGLAHASRIQISESRVSAEVGFSIDADERSNGLASRLMERVITHCRDHGVNTLFMSCLRENKKMQSLARKFGLNMTINFDEAYAELELT